MVYLTFLSFIASVLLIKAIVTPDITKRINEYLPIPNATEARAHADYLTQEPHLAGTEGNERTHQYILDKWVEFGIPAGTRAPFPTLINYPIDRSVELQGPTPFNASLQEIPRPEDPTSNNTNTVMTFAGFGPTGDVTAGVVYANYGLREDFELLESLGVSVEGKIVIVRYGGITDAYPARASFRGAKAREASLKGAVGVLIYSDPADDGFVRGPVYPDGIWRPADGAQRGSFQYIMVCPGDPSPRRSEICLNNPNANASGVLYANIPIQPLSWSDAEPILRAIGGPVVPNPDWQGGINFTYTLGGQAAPLVRLRVNNSWEERNLTNLIARIEGTEAPNEYVIIGNHHDAWVFGAFDPVSGTSAMLELSRGIGQLLQNGWKPKRTLIFASWDGEEYGLIGSTQWAEANPDILKNTVAYLNVDVAVKGKTFGLSATPSLSSFIREVITLVNEPELGVPLSQVWDGKISVLGSGSDFTAFIHHFGVPSVDMGFSGGDGVYHSIFDSFTWMNKTDPTFVYHRTIAQLWGAMLITLADLDVSPIYYTDTASALKSYLDTTKASLPVPYPIDLTALENAIYSFGTNAWLVQGKVINAVNSNQSIQNSQSLNHQLYDTEKLFLNPEGLPSRYWYKHTLQAPGISTGYGSETFPGLTFAITDKNWPLAQQQANILTERISAASSQLQGPSESKSDAAVIGLAFAFGFVTLILIFILIRYRFNRRSGDIELTGQGNQYNTLEK